MNSPVRVPGWGPAPWPAGAGGVQRLSPYAHPRVLRASGSVRLWGGPWETRKRHTTEEGPNLGLWNKVPPPARPTR